MVIDELKDEYSELRAPEHIDTFDQGNGDRSGGLIGRLKDADTRSKRILRRFYIAYFTIAVLYFAIFILNPDSDLKLNDRINGTLLFIGIMLFAILAKRNYANLDRIRYDQDTASFLHDALNRYKFWNTEMNYVFVGVLIINIGSCRSYVLHYQAFDNILFDIALFEAVFLTTMAVGLYFGLKRWRTHKKAIYLDIYMLLREEINT